MKSLMRLDDYFVPSFSFNTRPPANAPDISQDSPSMNINISFQILENSDKNEFIIPLRIHATSPNESDFSYESLFIEIHGVFSFPKDTESVEIKKYVPLLCLTNLYGIARGIISQSTALSPSGPFILPLVNMKKVVDDFLLHQQESMKNDDEISNNKDNLPVHSTRRTKKKTVSPKKASTGKKKTSTKKKTPQKGSSKKKMHLKS